MREISLECGCGIHPDGYWKMQFKMIWRTAVASEITKRKEREIYFYLKKKVSIQFFHC